MKKVNAFDLIYFGGTNIILLCNIYVYKYIPLRNSFCESSSADLLTLQLFLKIHLYFTDAQPQPTHLADLWPKTNSSRSKSSPLCQPNILCSLNIFHSFISTPLFEERLHCKYAHLHYDYSADFKVVRATTDVLVLLKVVQGKANIAQNYQQPL